MYLNPSGLPELENYPRIRKFLEKHVDMLFSDLRLMLRAPFEFIEDELKGTGCNFSAYVWEIHILEGFSVVFSKDPQAVLLQKRGRRELFVEFISEYYPSESGWDTPEGPELRAELLYVARNPIVHALGIDLAFDKKLQKFQKILGGIKFQPIITKSPLKPAQIQELELGKKPSNSTTIKIEYNAIFYNVPTLYWGIYELLRKLFNDKERISTTERFLEKYRPLQ